MPPTGLFDDIDTPEVPSPIAALLGIPAKQILRAERLSDGRRIAIELAGSGGEPWNIVLAPPGFPAFVRTATLGLSHAGPLDRDLERFLRKLAARLGRTPFANVLDALDVQTAKIHADAALDTAVDTRAVDSLLGLPRAAREHDAPIGLSRCILLSDTREALLVLGRGADDTVAEVWWIEAGGDGRGALVLGDEAVAALPGALLEHLLARVEPLRFDDLWTTFETDPRTTRSTRAAWPTLPRVPAQRPPAPEQPEHADPTPEDRADAATHQDAAIGFGYAPADAWMRFLQERENSYGTVENERGYRVAFGADAVLVSHTDIECHYSAPPKSDDAVGFWNHLRVDPIDMLVGGGPFDGVFTDMSDRDVIKGGGPRLDALMDVLAGSVAPGTPLLVGATCLTTVIGDDVQRSVERLTKRVSLPVVKFDGTLDPRVVAWRRGRARAAGTTPADPHAVNLVGLPRMPGVHPLLELLREAGVRVNAWFLPSIDESEIARWDGAAVDVVHAWATIREPVDLCLSPLGRPRIDLAAPHGMEASRRWFTAVAEAAGRSEQAAEVWDRHIATLRPRWDRARAALDGHRVAFAGAAGRVDRFLAARELLGLLPLETMQELGLEVEIWRGHVPYRAATRAFPATTERTFDGPAELEALLRTSGVSAVYSELHFDRRLSRCGVAGFSLRDIGFLGPHGAVRIGDAMRARCQMSFYRRYGRHFGAPFAGIEALQPRNPRDGSPR